MSDPVLITEPNGQQGVVRAEEELKVSVYKRLEAEGLWAQVEPIRNAMMKEARAKGLSKEEAQNWTYGELDRLYPPLPPELDPQPPETVDDQQGEETGIDSVAGDEAATQADEAPPRTRATGIPPGWPELPPNASLAAEIAWVQANRLDVVDGDKIRLDRAKEPAPSRSALGWLETSIRSYAKYVEVAAKATSAGLDEQDQAKRERMALDEVRALLAEMVQ